MIIADVVECCTIGPGSHRVMNLTLRPEDERFLNEQVKSGRYHSAEDAVAEAIDRLRWEDEITPTADDLAAVREGLAQLDRGEGIPWEQVRRDFNAKYGLGGGGGAGSSTPAHRIILSPLALGKLQEIEEAIAQNGRASWRGSV